LKILKVSKLLTFEINKVFSTVQKEPGEGLASLGFQIFTTKKLLIISFLQPNNY